MASSSSSSVIAKSEASRFCPSSESETELEEFDAFVCFTGNTRWGFTSHLVKALKQAGVNTFTDELLPRGEALSDALTGRIKASRSTIIVVSKDFAASEWCLNEVMESFKCKEEKAAHAHGHCIFPIFYKVDPSELRHLRGKTAHYLSRHEQRYGSNSDRVAWWRTCLVLLSNIAGWHLPNGRCGITLGRQEQHWGMDVASKLKFDLLWRNPTNIVFICRNESEFIEIIVEEIVKTLALKNTALL